MGRVMIGGAWADLDALLDRTYKRDKDGRFASGGVRQSLADAKTTAEINTAAAAEAKRITGRVVSFDFARSDPQTAREHAEGVLQGLERFPNTDLVRVHVAPLGDGVYAEAGYRVIRFDSTWSGNREKYLGSLAEGAAGWDKGLRVYGISDMKVSSFHVRNSTSPTSIALHEFGHVLDTTTGGRSHPRVDDLLRREFAAEQHTQSVLGSPVRSPADLVVRAVSGYAATNRRELLAEAFTDVMLNGSGASVLSRGIFDIVKSEYR